MDYDGDEDFCMEGITGKTIVYPKKLKRKKKTNNIRYYEIEG